MSIGSFGIIGGIAATPLAQKGTEAERAPAANAAAQRETQSVQQAETAAGIGEADGQEHAPNERDADGRLPWQIPPRAAEPTTDPATGVETPRPVKDPTGEAGNQLDLSG